MDQFEGGGRVGGVLRGEAEEGRAFNDEQRSHALAAAEDGMAHGRDQTSRLWFRRLAGDRLIRKDAIESGLGQAGGRVEALREGHEGLT